MKHQTALLLDRFGWPESRLASNRFANHLSVGAVVLLPLDVALHIGRRHQAPGVPDACSSRDPWCDEAHASIPTSHGASFWKKAKTCRRFN